MPERPANPSRWCPIVAVAIFVEAWKTRAIGLGKPPFLQQSFAWLFPPTTHAAAHRIEGVASLERLDEASRGVPMTGRPKQHRARSEKFFRIGQKRA